MNFQRIPIAIFCLFVRVSYGYIPTPHDIKLLDQFFQQTSFQMAAYGLAKSAAENNFSGTNFLPFYHLGSACLDYINQQPTPEQYAKAAALASAGLIGAASTVALDNPNISVMIGTLLYEIAKALHENTGVSFTFMYSSIEIAPGIIVPVIYYLATLYTLLMMGGFTWLIVTLIKYRVTLKRFKKFKKQQKIKQFLYLNRYKTPFLVKCASYLIINEYRIVKTLKI